MNIGFVTTWKTRGTKYQTKLMMDAIPEKYKISLYIYKHLELDPGDDLDYVFKKKIGDWSVKRWLIKNKIEAVFFIDRLGSNSVLNFCKKKNIKTMTTIMYETIFDSFYDRYAKHDHLIAPVKCTEDLLNELGFKNTFNLPWTTDIEIYKKPAKQDNNFKLFFNSGWGGGVNWRKNPESVVKSFDIASKQNDNVELIFKTQKPIEEYSDIVQQICEQNDKITVVDINMPYAKLLDLYKSCDVSLLPSKWEGIGIPFPESLALSLPVITIDAPPMNEWIIDGVNGFTAAVDSWGENKKSKRGTCQMKAANIDIDQMSECIIKICNKETLNKMIPQTYKTIENRTELFLSKMIELLEGL